MHGSIEHYSATQFTILNWSLCAFSIVFTTVRVITRYQLLKTLRLEDYFAIIATIFMLLMAVANEIEKEGIYMAVGMVEQLSAGKSIAELDPPYPVVVKSGETYIKWQFAFMMFFWTSVWGVKASLLTFYRNLFVNVPGYMLWYWLVVGLTVATYVGSFLTNILICLPVSKRWAQTGQCSSTNAVVAVYVASAFDVVTDICIMILPVRLIMGVQIPLRQKIALAGIFCLGIIIVIFALLRMQKLVYSIGTKSPSGNIIVAMWSVIEAFVAIVVGNLPALKSFISRKSESYAQSSGPMPSRQTHDRSKVGPDSHIRLYDMPGGHTTEVGTKYGSDEALNTNAQGITKTQQVVVTVSNSNRLNHQRSTQERSDRSSLESSSIEAYKQHPGAAV